MGTQEKSQIKTFAAGFIGVIGMGSLLILYQGGAAAKAPVVSYAPVDADSGLTAPARAAQPSLSGAPLGASGPDASSPAPLLSDEVRDEDAPAAVRDPGAAAVAGPIPSVEKLVVGPHLDGAESASSSAAASEPRIPSATMKKSSSAPKLGRSKNRGVVASTVHYGVSSRAELMGRADGPIYNFSGKSLGRAAEAVQQVAVVRKQFDAADASADDQAKLDQGLNQFHQAVISAPAGQ